MGFVGDMVAQAMGPLVTALAVDAAATYTGVDGAQTVALALGSGGQAAREARVGELRRGSEEILFRTLAKADGPSRIRVNEDRVLTGGATYVVVEVVEEGPGFWELALRRIDASTVGSGGKKLVVGRSG